MNTFQTSSTIPRQGVDYLDDSICLVSNIAQMMEYLPQTVLMDEYLIVLVLNGYARVHVDNEDIDVHGGQIFACCPQTFLRQTMISMDIEIRGCAVSREKAQQLLSETELNWSFVSSMGKYNLAQVDSKQQEILCLYYDLLRSQLQAPDSPSKRLSLRHLYFSFIYETNHAFSSTNRPLPARSYSSAENYFEHFIRLLEDPRQPLMNVSGYAERLNITPKYFSMICKMLAGKSAKVIITEETIKRAKILLRNQSLSIKQVADCLGFPNQSHFGTYFHRHMGCSPQQFRREKEG